MKRLRKVRVARVAALVVAIAVGCGSGGGGSTGVSQVVGPEGAAITITAAGDPAIAGAGVFIPPLALAKAQVVTLSRGAELGSSTVTALGPAVEFAPDTLAFAKAVTLTLPYTVGKLPVGAAVAIAVASGGKQGVLAGDAIVVDATSGTVKADVRHFGDYQVVAGQHLQSQCSADVDCGNGKHCTSGVCGNGPPGDGGTGDGGSGDDGGGDGGGGDGGGDGGGGIDGSGFDGASDGGLSDGGGADAKMTCFSDADCPTWTHCHNGTCS